jgi:hypothetical protein
MTADVVITIHGSVIVGEPLHLRGEGSPNCLTCHPPAFPARLVADHGHGDLVSADDIHNANIKQLAERVAVVEQILSDAIPPQPGEPGHEAER